MIFIFSLPLCCCLSEKEVQLECLFDGETGFVLILLVFFFPFLFAPLLQFFSSFSFLLEAVVLYSTILSFCYIQHPQPLLFHERYQTSSDKGQTSTSVLLSFSEVWLRTRSDPFISSRPSQEQRASYSSHKTFFFSLTYNKFKLLL